MSSRSQAILIGGVFIGVLSALPVVSLANCCCLWVAGGGIVAAYLRQQGQSHALPVGEGALVGCLAGVCGAVVHTMVSLPIMLFMAPMQEQLAEMLRGNADVPPEVAEMIEQIGAAGPLALMVSFGFMLVFGMIFSTLGGVLGTVIFRGDRPALATEAEQ